MINLARPAMVVTSLTKGLETSTSTLNSAGSAAITCLQGLRYDLHGTTYTDVTCVHVLTRVSVSCVCRILKTRYCVYLPQVPPSLSTFRPALKVSAQLQRLMEVRTVAWNAHFHPGHHNSNVYHIDRRIGGGVEALP